MSTLAVNYQSVDRVPATTEWTEIRPIKAGVCVCVPNGGCWPSPVVSSNGNVNARQNYGPVLRARRLNGGMEFQLNKLLVNGGGEILLLAAEIGREW